MSYAVSKVSAASPDMSESEMSELAEDIRRNGQLVPIWIRGAEVIDGRKRLAACQRLGIKPKVVNVDPEQDVEQLSRSLNVLRTHYTSSQRAMFSAERPHLVKGNVARQVDQLIHQTPIRNAQAAKDAGVSEPSIKRAKRIARDGAPEVADAVKRGDLTLHAATQIVTGLPIAEQADAVVRVVEASKGKGRNTPTARVLDGVDVRKHRAQPAKPEEQFARSIQMLAVAVDVCITNAPLVTRSFKRATWLEVLTESRTTITHIIKALEN